MGVSGDPPYVGLMSAIQLTPRLLCEELRRVPLAEMRLWRIDRLRLCLEGTELDGKQQCLERYPVEQHRLDFGSFSLHSR